MGGRLWCLINGLEFIYRLDIFTSCNEQDYSVVTGLQLIEKPHQALIHLFYIRDRLTKYNRLTT